MAAALGLFEIDVWWELASLITIMLLGHWLEMRAVSQAHGALNALAALLPDSAERVAGADTESVPLADLRVGDIVLVRPGARVPADGVVVEGSAEVDESMISGESKTLPKGAGDRVVAGTIATVGSLRVRVTATGDQTALSGIMRLVASAQASGSRAQALADRAAALLFYVAVASGAITFAYWWFAGRPYARAAAIAWNLFGMADLVNAVTIGSLTGGGGGGIVFPIVLIPIYGVPRAFLIHSYSLIGLLRKSSRRPASTDSLHDGAARATA